MSPVKSVTDVSERTVLRTRLIYSEQWKRMLQIGDRRVLIADHIEDCFLSAELECVHPHPRGFCRGVLASSRFDSDRVAACG